MSRVRKENTFSRIFNEEIGNMLCGRCNEMNCPLNLPNPFCWWFFFHFRIPPQLSTDFYCFCSRKYDDNKHKSHIVSVDDSKNIMFSASCQRTFSNVSELRQTELYRINSVHNEQRKSSGCLSVQQHCSHTHNTKQQKSNENSIWFDIGHLIFTMRIFQSEMQCELDLSRLR